MGARSRRFYRVLALLLILVVPICATFATAPRAEATAQEIWAAWSVEVDFPDGKLQVLYTAYTGTNGSPPTILDFREDDITDDCTNHGVKIGTGYARFENQAYIECNIPAWSTFIAQMNPNLPMAGAGPCECRPGRAPFFVAANVQLSPTPGNHPMFELQRQAIRMNLRSDGANVRTEVGINGDIFRSAPYLRDNTSNRMITGMNGPAITAAASYFGWLDFLTDPDWESFYNNHVVDRTVGHWEEPSTTRDTDSATQYYMMRTDEDVLYIGYSPRTNTYLDGILYKGHLDPGCVGY